MKLVVIILYFATKNEKLNERFRSKLETCNNCKINVIWNIHKILSLFNNKDKAPQLSCIIYKDVCSCGTDYSEETIRNVNDEKRMIMGLTKNKKVQNIWFFTHEFYWFVARNSLKPKIL